MRTSEHFSSNLAVLSTICVFKLLLSKKMKVSWCAIINNILTTYIFTLSLSMTGAKFLDHEDSMGVDTT
jgi:membrane-associated PAP2 superfamily phosphatase